MVRLLHIILTHLRLIIGAIGRIYFECKGCWIVSFNSIQILKVHSVTNSAETGQTPRPVASDLVLHCLPMPPKSMSDI